MSELPPRSQPEHQVGSKRDQHVIMRDGARLAADVFRPLADGVYPTLLSIGVQGRAFRGLAPVAQYRMREAGPIDWYVERGYAFVHVDARGSGQSDGSFDWMGPAFQTDLYDVVEWIADQPWCSGKVGMIGSGFAGAAQWLAAVQRPPHLRCIAPYDAWLDPYRDLAYHGGIASDLPRLRFNQMRSRRMLDFPDKRWPSRAPVVDAVVKRLVDGQSSTLEQAGLRAMLRARRMMERVLPRRLANDPVLALLEAPLDGPLYWMNGASTRLSTIETPFYSIAHWSSLGISLRGNMLAYELIEAPKKLLVCGSVGEPSIWPLVAPPDAYDQVQAAFSSLELHEELLRWYDYWLKDLPNAIMDEPPVRYWMQTEGRYREADAWPPSGLHHRRLYLRAGTLPPVHSLNDGLLSFDAPQGEAPPSEVSVPDPAWTGPEGLGTAVLSKSGVPDRIRRILTFTSAPLDERLDVTGPVRLTLYVSSSDVDADFVVRLADVPPTDAEQARLLAALDLPPQGFTVSRGWLRASHRALDAARTTVERPWHVHEQAEPLEPDVVVPLEIEIWSTAWRFEPGHCIRLEIAPGDSSYFERPVTHHFGIREAVDRIWHDEARPSSLLLPVLS